MHPWSIGHTETHKQKRLHRYLPCSLRADMFQEIGWNMHNHKLINMHLSICHGGLIMSIIICTLQTGFRNRSKGIGPKESPSLVKAQF